MLEDFRLQVFHALVQERSFTKAAAILGISQPAVSQNIAELEKMVGMKLFERLRGEVVITQEGLVFKDYADRLSSVCSSAGNMFAKLPPSTVKLSVSEEVYNYLVAPALESFSRIHPEVTFERAIFDDADLKISLMPSDGSPYNVPADSIARIRMSIFPVPQSADIKSTHERTSYFDLIFQPTSAFSCTRVCRLIKEFLVS
ncbi:MAG: LysR family transcriptional regulator [Bacteroidales bacterium]|nr:LysR family transcriptional regulator [Bacteroidales bacterium]